MELFLKAMADMEAACDSEAALLNVHLPNITELVDALKALPLAYQDDLRDRLERIQIIMESQMLLYAAETERLREAIRAANLPKTSLATKGEIASIRIPVMSESVSSTLQ